MADAIVSVVAQRLATIVEEQIRNEIHLVRGVKKEVLHLSRELKKVRDLLDDADRRGFKDKSIRGWLKRLEDASYEMDDVLDEWNISLINIQMEQSDAFAAPKQKVCPFIPHSSCLNFKKVASRRDMAQKVKNVKAQLDMILVEKDRYNFIVNQRTNSFDELDRVTTSFLEIEEVKGRDDDRDNLVSKIISKSVSANQGDPCGQIHMTSLVGTGGIGKTTLAQLIYNDSRVKDCFKLKIWICVSDPFDEVRIAKEIVESVKGSAPTTNRLEVLLELVEESVSKKKFFLVLDDVWNRQDTKWGPLKRSLKCGGDGSRILVTTRDRRVAEMMGANMEHEFHEMKELSDDYCWSLLSRIAFTGRSDKKNKGLEDIGRQIARKCGGLPLAAKALGSLLRFKNTAEEWEDILNSEIWQLENAKVDIFPHLSLSYNDLSLPQKRCFSYCALFPKDYVFEVNKLIECWMALGYLSSSVGDASNLELRGRECFDNLAMRSLFQNFAKDPSDEQIIVKCKMHDIIHDFALFLRESDDSESLNDGLMNTSAPLKAMIGCKAHCPSFVSRIKRYRSLICDGQKFPDVNVCDCLTSVRMLSVTGCRSGIIPWGVKKLIHLRYLNLSHTKLHAVDKVICKLFNLKTLLLRSCLITKIWEGIGNLIELRQLDLSNNDGLRELPESICDLRELRSLNVDGCEYLRLPEGIHKLINLKHLHIEKVYRLPQALGQLTGLRTLQGLHVGQLYLSNLGLLKKLNRLSGSLNLRFDMGLYFEEEVGYLVQHAREAELRKKQHIQKLTIYFYHFLNKENIEFPMTMGWTDLLRALEPHPNLQYLEMQRYMGDIYPEWIWSPICQLKEITLKSNSCSLLPPLGKLQCLEKLTIEDEKRLQFVGREFLGITTSSSSSSSASCYSVGFPKLKSLTFDSCYNWNEWEDLTNEEEESIAVSVMPCLMDLEIYGCTHLTVLPHRLLRKASALHRLSIKSSTQLYGSYKEGPLTKFISHIPRVEIRYSW